MNYKFEDGFVFDSTESWKSALCIEICERVFFPVLALDGNTEEAAVVKVHEILQSICEAHGYDLSDWLERFEEVADALLPDDGGEGIAE